MDRLEKIVRELAPLDAARVPGFASQQNMAFLAALDKHWPTIRGMLTIARSPVTPDTYISDRTFYKMRPVSASRLDRIRKFFATR